MNDLPSYARQPILSLLSELELDEIHARSLEVLERTGINVHHREARERLARAGAAVEGDLRVRIPSALVKRALASAPERVVLATRQGVRTMPLEPRRVYFGTGSDLKYTIDHVSGKRRESLLSDVAAAAKVSDALPNIDFILSYGLPSDVAFSEMEVRQFDTMVRASTKPIIMTVFSGIGSLERIYRMACEVAGGEESYRRNPFFGVYGQFISPFQHGESDVAALLYCAEKSIPIIYVPTVMAGANGPATMAGSLVEGNAETLAGLVMHQLWAPGAPFIYGGCVSSFDMREGKLAYGAPEWHMASAVLTQLSRRYRLPVFSTGGATDAKTLDGQATAEGTYSILLSALSGANLIHDVGYMESGLTGCLEYLAICDEVCGLVRRILRSFEVTAETLAVDLIDAVGPGGNYFTREHTLAHYRGETWYPGIFDRRNFEGWTEDGSTSVNERARRKVDLILAEHAAPELDPAVAARLDRILAGE